MVVLLCARGAVLRNSTIGVFSGPRAIVGLRLTCYVDTTPAMTMPNRVLETKRPVTFSILTFCHPDIRKSTKLYAV